MKKTTYILFALAAVLSIFASACGPQAAEPTAAPAPTQAAPQVPTPKVEQPTQTVVIIQATTGPSFAPTCQNVSSSCTAPDVKDTVASETTCVQKVPYQLVIVPEGTTFEVVDPQNLTCVDNGAKQGDKHIIECHGKELWTSDLKLTNVACGSNTLVTGTGQCQDGYGFDSTQNCCAPVTTNAGNSTTIKVNMGGCPDGVQP